MVCNFSSCVFFFNYVGEEILWRGYILPRQLNSNYGKYAILINALFHCSYHFVFGINMLMSFKDDLTDIEIENFVNEVDKTVQK
ncbi:CPBP family intramembrane metalloprotease [Bariatricus massiliensis]|uniref:CPBP family intramembrane metalloprotease n=1 Tax=Bariatricus massiliensis TaxID=1745713 RepID=A0ABS8DEE2_9FIRM|nr:CPBP family intramembrane glutamic endopeptidase [Bariatricus massiliensis]MCB7302854.1 CPBP family intramembrane metalloprotease [Bariatricus massiliensis]MCB7374070.1 CPBP family intramembrane metalloprotease [Bariatricus massiliensis]MCB7386740.1 CPBP family intramembrane metalloprotease [Bariatricus massiliensis]MCB7410902.1 CPBP family intramembrane metalloprotease [Bariatricus massiliensis]MCQ5251726.1 CPBP family intramembrane metalloprotease [Bariatricus massiliensis]